MSKASRKLQVGAAVVTDFSGKLSQHKITERKEGTSQSGIMFRVIPCVKGSGGKMQWLDADWFEPIHLMHELAIRRQRT